MPRGYKPLLLGLLIFPILMTISARAEFKDVLPTSKYADLLNKVQKLGLMVGYPDGTFKPLEPLNRFEAAALVYRLQKAISEEMTRMQGSLKDFARFDALRDLQKSVDSLSTEFKAEISLINGRLDGVEARITELEGMVKKLEEAKQTAQEKPKPRSTNGRGLEIAARTGWMMPWKESLNETVVWGLELGIPRGGSIYSLGYTGNQTQQGAPALDVSMNRWDISYGRTLDSKKRLSLAAGPSLFTASAAGVSDNVWGYHARVGYRLWRSVLGEITYSSGDFSNGTVKFRAGGLGFGLGYGVDW